MAIRIRDFVQKTFLVFGLRKRPNPSCIMRSLRKDESHILGLIRELYGDKNQPSECFGTDRNDAAIFVKDPKGEISIMVNLTNIAKIAKEENLTDKDIQEIWLKPQCGSPSSMEKWLESYAMEERRYDMDWIRVIAMLLVVSAVLHAGCWTETRKPVMPTVATTEPMEPVKRMERPIQSVTLQCQAHGEQCFSFYSFMVGVLPTPPTNPDLVDLVYFYDADDCSQGALVGRDDRPGYLFPVGFKSRDELAALKPPAKGSQSVAAIMPLTADKEGLAFWVKARGGQFFLVRIAAVQPATYAELKAGKTARMDIEWSGPVVQGP